MITVWQICGNIPDTRVIKTERESHVLIYTYGYFPFSIIMSLHFNNNEFALKFIDISENKTGNVFSIVCQRAVEEMIEDMWVVMSAKYVWKTDFDHLPICTVRNRFTLTLFTDQRGYQVSPRTDTLYISKRHISTGISSCIAIYDCPTGLDLDQMMA